MMLCCVRLALKKSRACYRDRLWRMYIEYFSNFRKSGVAKSGNQSLAHTTDSPQANCTNHTTCCATYQPQLTLITSLKRIALHIVPQRWCGE